MHANLPRIAKRWERDYANGGMASQGGMKNYLGEQPMVNAPQNWRSGPDSPPTELAYITQPEKELILRSNIHGSLGQGPNEGPSGIMSLNGQGDYTRDRSPGSASRGRSPTAQANEAHMRSVLTGQQNIGQTSAVSERTRRGAVPEYAFGPDGQQKYIGSAYKSTGQPGFLSNMFSRTPGYRSIYNKQGWFGGPDIQFNPNKGRLDRSGRYEFSDPRTGNVKPGWGGRILGGLASMATGIPFVGGAVGSAIDYGKGIFSRKPRDMSLFNKYGLGGSKDYLPKGTLDFDPNAQIQSTSFEQNLPENIKALNTYNDMIPGLETKFVNQDAPGPWNNFTPGGITNIDINEDVLDINEVGPRITQIGGEGLSIPKEWLEAPFSQIERTIQNLQTGVDNANALGMEGSEDNEKNKEKLEQLKKVIEFKKKKGETAEGIAT